MDPANVLDKSYFHQVPNTFLHFRGGFLGNQFISPTFVSHLQTPGPGVLLLLGKFANFATRAMVFCLIYCQMFGRCLFWKGEGKTICDEMGQWTKYVVNSNIESCNIKVTFSNQRALTRSICWGFRRLWDSNTSPWTGMPTTNNYATFSTSLQFSPSHQPPQKNVFWEKHTHTQRKIRTTSLFHVHPI